MDGLFDNALLIFVALFLVGMAGLAGWLALQHFSRSGMSFFQSQVKRLGLVEVASIGSGRRLMLIRRDNVEHLIMTGGPIDIVVEVGIGAQQRQELPIQDAPRYAEALAYPQAYSRPASPDEGSRDEATFDFGRDEASAVEVDSRRAETPRRKKLPTPTLSSLLSVVERKINPKKAETEAEKGKASATPVDLAAPIELGDETQAEKIQ